MVYVSTPLWSTGSTKFNPINAQEDKGVPFDRNFISILRRDHQFFFPMSVATISLYRRKEPISSYFPKKNDEKMGP